MSEIIDKSEEIVSTETEGLSSPIRDLSTVSAAGGDAELMEYFGSDSTCVNEITEVSIVDDHEAEFEDQLKSWAKKSSKVKPDQVDTLINEGIEIMEQITADTNRYINHMTMSHAKRAIIVGTIGNKLKPLVKQKGDSWSDWADKNLAFIGRRNRERYMMIAKRADSHPYTFLGIDRLEMLCSATKKAEGKDPIGDLLRCHDITFDPEAEINLQAFKAKIDATLSSQRLAKQGLTVDFNLIVNLLCIGVEVDNSLIRTLSTIQNSGGDPARHLENLVSSGGKETVDSESAGNPKDFNKLSNRLIQTIENLIKGFTNETVPINEMDRDAFSTLRIKLEELNSIANLIEEETE